jgi:hypothetical protein
LAFPIDGEMSQRIAVLFASLPPTVFGGRPDKINSIRLAEGLEPFCIDISCIYQVLFWKQFSLFENFVSRWQVHVDLG